MTQAVDVLGIGSEISDPVNACARVRNHHQSFFLVHVRQVELANQSVDGARHQACRVGGVEFDVGDVVTVRFRVGFHNS